MNFGLVISLGVVGAQLRTQQNPIVSHLKISEGKAGAIITSYNLRQQDVLGGWRKNLRRHVEENNNATLDFALRWNVSAIENFMERKLLDYGYHKALIDHGKPEQSGDIGSTTPATIESYLLSHEAVTRLLLASCQTEQSFVVPPSLRLHVSHPGEDEAKFATPDRHHIAPMHPLLYERDTKQNNEFVNPLKLTNDLASLLGFTVPASLILKDRLTVTVNVPTPYATPRQPPPRVKPKVHSQSFVVYQSKGAFTGGTTALALLVEELEYQGHDVLVCDENNVYDSLDCLQPPINAIVITGEWCRGVTDEYGVGNHRGRSIQYVLGFHFDHPCRGAVPLAASHYLSLQLGNRLLGGYYLSAPMHHGIRDAFLELLLKGKMLDSCRASDTNGGDWFFGWAQSPEGRIELLSKLEGTALEELLVSTISWGHGQQTIVSIPKENLIVIDPDLSRDYTPEETVPFAVPAGYRVAYAKDVHPDDMPLLLQRAKVLLDLAMPGPERLSAEAILLGTIPVISNRWNGASDVDFPGVIRVDPQNSTSLTEIVSRALTDYESLISDPLSNGRFFAYVASQWERHRNTIKILASSAGLHFVLAARGLAEERAAVLRLFALLYLYPLASVDIYVIDRGWFLRHHYLAATLLRRGGYLRRDEADPADFLSITTSFLPSHNSSSGETDSKNSVGGASHVRVLRLSHLDQCNRADGTTWGAGVAGQESVDPPEWQTVPPWAHSVVILPTPSTKVFSDPLFLLDLVEGHERGGITSLEVKVVNGNDEKASSSSEIVALVMSTQTALTLHSCLGYYHQEDNLPPHPHTLLYVLSFRGGFNLLTSLIGMLPKPQQRVDLSNDAIADVARLRTGVGDGGGVKPFIDGLGKTPAWNELITYYAAEILT